MASRGPEGVPKLWVGLQSVYLLVHLLGLLLVVHLVLVAHLTLGGASQLLELALLEALILLLARVDKAKLYLLHLEDNLKAIFMITTNTIVECIILKVQ